MAKEIDKIKYEGNNDKLVERVSCDNLASNAQLIVPPTHWAVLITDGQLMETYDGGRYDIFETKKGFLGKAKKTSISVDVIFISKGYEFDVRWGTPNQIDYLDSATEYIIKYGVNGVMNASVSDPRKLYVKAVGSDKEFYIEKLQEKIRDRALLEIKDVLSAYMYDNKLSFWHFSQNLKTISTKLTPIFSKMMEADFGIKLNHFIINDIFLRDDVKEKIKAFYEDNKDQMKRDQEEIKAKREREEEEAKRKAELLEQIAMIERMEDREFEKQKFLLELEKKDRAMFYDVAKAIGWEGGKQNSSGATGGKFCSRCGMSVGAGDKFCSGCGNVVGEVKITCPVCKQELSAGVKFCPGCGNKVN